MNTNWMNTTLTHVYIFVLHMCRHSRPLIKCMYVRHMYAYMCGGCMLPLPSPDDRREGMAVTTEKGKENLTKTNMYVQNNSVFRVDIRNTGKQWKTKATIKLYIDKLKVTSTIINEKYYYYYCMCTCNSDVQRHSCIQKTKDYKDYKYCIHINPIKDRAWNRCMYRQ